MRTTSNDDRGKTATKPSLLRLLGLLLSEKQIPQVVEKLESGDKPKEALETVGLRPREPRRFQRFHRFSKNPNIYNNLGESAFAQKANPMASIDRVRTQFWHSGKAGARSRSSTLASKTADLMTIGPEHRHPYVPRRPSAAPRHSCNIANHSGPGHQGRRGPDGRHKCCRSFRRASKTQARQTGRQ